jgi:hypothetical protein
VLVCGAAIYVLAASSLPVGTRWFDAYLIPLYGGTLALGALVLSEATVRGALARVFLGIALLGVVVGWDAVGSRPLAASLSIAAGLAVVTYAALWIDEPEQPLWSPSALVLPGLSLGVAMAAADTREALSLTLAVWGALALAMWRAERAREHDARGSTHLFLGILIVAIAIGNQLTLESLWLIVGLAGWGVVAAALARHEPSALPLLGACSVLLAAGSAALILFTERIPYTQLPFATRESAGALVVLGALAVSGALLHRGRGLAGQHVTRGVAAAVPAAFGLWWGRMELVEAFSPDSATFLLTLYYAVVGVAAIVAGRRWGLAALRIGGLTVALYAGAKAVVQATGIEGLGLRVGCYVLVGVFLLAAGWVYRDARVGERP